jgi:hypothetical protein
LHKGQGQPISTQVLLFSRQWWSMEPLHHQQLHQQAVMTRSSQRQLMSAAFPRTWQQLRRPQQPGLQQCLKLTRAAPRLQTLLQDMANYCQLTQHCQQQINGTNQQQQQQYNQQWRQRHQQQQKQHLQQCLNPSALR